MDESILFLYFGMNSIIHIEMLRAKGKQRVGSLDIRARSLVGALRLGWGRGGKWSIN